MLTHIVLCRAEYKGREGGMKNTKRNEEAYARRNLWSGNHNGIRGVADHGPNEHLHRRAGPVRQENVLGVGGEAVTARNEVGHLPADVLHTWGSHTQQVAVTGGQGDEGTMCATTSRAHGMGGR